VLALGALAGGAAAAQLRDEIGLEAFAAVPVSIVLAFVALSLASRARVRHGRTLGRSGGRVLAGTARVLAGLALVLSATALVALGFFFVLVLTQ
jgi:hypothetical protein